jgi:hypothetical protein
MVWCSSVIDYRLISCVFAVRMALTLSDTQALEIQAGGGGAVIGSRP